MLGARFCPSPLDKAFGKTAYEARKTSQDAAPSKTPISSQLEPQPRSLSCLYLHHSNRTDAGDLRILDDPLACSVNILEVCLRKDALMVALSFRFCFYILPAASVVQIFT